MNKESSFTTEALMHHKYFLNIARKYTHNQMDAEDLVQDTFIRAYRFYDSYNQGSNCKAWLYTIMKHLYLNYTRKYKNVIECSFDEVPEVYEPVEDPVYTREEIMKLLLKIKEEFRIVITLFYIDDFSLKEISRRLNCPVGTVKSRLHRGRLEFRKILQCNA